MTQLSLVQSEADEVIDITAKLRADIAARDWAACHIRGDRSEVIDFYPKRLRTWRK
jgi:hypothetical protein